MLPAKPVTPADIVEAARKYLGAEFGHQGRSHPGDKRPQIDCVGLLFCVSEDLGLSDRLGVLVHRYDSCEYGPQPLDEFIHAECKRRLELVEEFGKPPLRSGLLAKVAVGQALTLRIPNVICHAAIVTGAEPNPTIIYALPAAMKLRPGQSSRRRGAVVETLLAHYRGSIAGVFRFPGVTY